MIKCTRFGGRKLPAWLLVPSLLLLGIAPVSSLAAEGEKGSVTDIFDAAYLLQVFGSLLLVFGCIFGLIFLLKKLNGLPAGNRSPIRVIGTVRVGAREKILLVEAGEQQLLVGVATGNIRTLHVFDSPITDSVETPSQKTDFASLMGSSFASGKVP